MTGQKAMVRDLTLGTYTKQMSLAEAIIVAIRECQATGGGTIWLHRPECEGLDGDEGCWCDPISVAVDGMEVN